MLPPCSNGLNHARLGRSISGVDELNGAHSSPAGSVVSGVFPKYQVYEVLGRATALVLAGTILKVRLHMLLVVSLHL